MLAETKFIDIFNLLINFLVPILLIVLGYVAGKIAERRHFLRLQRREQAPGPLLTNLRRLPGDSVPTGMWLCQGNAVIASDYFKTFGAGLKKIFGGRLRTYETLIERARREAIQRMRSQAAARGADIVMNVRLETSRIIRSAVEVIAYGTAVTLQGPTHV